MDTALLEATAAALVAPGKGILAADESNGTMTKRLEGVGLKSSEEERRRYRSNLFATPGCEDAISGVILYDETIRQDMDDGTPIPDYLTSRGILPGIKVDTGTIDIDGCPGEKVTKGIEAEGEWADLGPRCAEYFEMGARFAKWRAVIKISDITPTEKCLDANAHELARYALICQKHGLVPIIEPEVLMDGDHDSFRCRLVTSEIIERTFEQCAKLGVHNPGTLLKPNMVISGKDSDEQNTRDKVATSTVLCLKKSVPREVGGIVFLSGGQSDEEATHHLNLMNDFICPWELSYSYGRALQSAALKAWAEDGAEASQAAFAHRAKMNSLARSGSWRIEME